MPHLEGLCKYIKLKIESSWLDFPFKSYSTKYTLFLIVEALNASIAQETISKEPYFAKLSTETPNFTFW